MSDTAGLPCPCCGHVTLSERGGYEICPVCFWEDDGSEDERRAGPNGVTLAEGRRNYLTLGVSEAKHLRHVRPPAADEPRRRIFRLVGERVQEVDSA